MKTSTFLSIICASAGLTNASPITRRAAVTDADILNYALTLEHLESTFYKQGLQNFTQEDFISAGFDETFFKNIQTVAGDEAAHVDFLTKALTAAGGKPVEPCTYAFPVTDVKSFVTVSSVLEGVGASAYLGAAASIAAKDTLTAAGSILTVEARHSSLLRLALKQDPVPQAFDVPLSLNEVFTLASAFIVSCPETNTALPVQAFPPLSLDPATPLPLKSGQSVTILTPGYELKRKDDKALFGAWISVTGPTFVPAEAVEGGFKLQVPEGFNGQSYVVLNVNKDCVSDDTVAAGPALVEITNT
ncbi:MAG: hypothetical protein M1825_002636 [Sarcosagium campestre]|nr:MAG: hypothetical protein M1825_002636 [Sarcosagium campestre]